MKRSQLAQFLVSCALASNLTIPGYYSESQITTLGKEDSMAKLAARYKVDLAAIRTEMKAADETKRSTSSSAGSRKGGEK
jgi:hypothetical protein